MCGISAVFAYAPGSPPVERIQLDRMCGRMSCRGPDGHGFWVSRDGRVGLGHRRLAIIDLSENGAQPMHDVRAGIVITFNGEIYNYRELRKELENKGHHFVSTSDTEVLLKLYLDRGPTMVAALRGMFAFALWDGRKHGLLLARDRFGIKPLYFADNGSQVRVASEVKALVAAGDVDTSPQPAGHVGFFLWGSIPEPFTLYRGITALRAGTTLWIEEGGARTFSEYGRLSKMLTEAEGQPRGDGDAAEVLRDALLDSVRHHLVSDVEVGVFLSAGLDSSTLLALATEVGGQFRTITLGFAEYRGTSDDETILAEQVAKRYGSDHLTMWITKEDFDGEVDRLIDRMDQPSIDGVNTYFVSRAAQQAGLKVVLSGLGADELFGGYPSFRQVPRLVSALSGVPGIRQLGRGFRRAASPLMERFASPKYAGVMEYGSTYAGAYLLRRSLFLPWELSSVLDPEMVRAGLNTLQVCDELERSMNDVRTPHLKVSALEATAYMRNQLLRDSDWASMSHSLEIRVPFVDPRLWSVCASLIGAGAPINKQTMANTPKQPLPTEVLTRKKTGFQTPVRRWIGSYAGSQRARGLRGWAQSVYRAAMQ